MPGETEQLRVLEVLKRDEWSVTGRGIDASGDGPQLVRRLIQSKRFSDEARASLIAEVEYGARIDHVNAPTGDLFEYADGEVVIRYHNKEGIELDRVLFALNSRGWTLTPCAAATLMGPVIEVAALISRNPPPDIDEATSWGHGEIAPRSLLLGKDGVARLFEARCAATALPWTRTADGRVCLSPELPSPTTAGTAEGDVFAIAAVLASGVVGVRRLISADNAPLFEAFERETLLLEDENQIDRGFAALVIRALSPEPAERLPLRSMSLALRHGLGLDEETTNELRLGLADLVVLLGERRDLMDVPEDYRHRWSKVICPAPPTRRSQSMPPSPSTDLPVLSEEATLPGSRPVSTASAWSVRGTVPRSVSPARAGPGGIPPPATTDVSRGFALEVLDDWNSMSKHLTGTFSVPHNVRARAKARRTKRRIGAGLMMTIGAGLLLAMVLHQRDVHRSSATTAEAGAAQTQDTPSETAPQARADAPPTDTAPEVGTDTANEQPELVRPPDSAARPPRPLMKPGKKRVERASAEATPPPAPVPTPKLPPIQTTKARLMIEVSPAARVEVDGDDFGYPPVALDDLPPGFHVVRIHREGYESVERRVRLRAGEDKRLEIRLVKAEP